MTVHPGERLACDLGDCCVAVSLAAEPKHGPLLWFQTSEQSKRVARVQDLGQIVAATDLRLRNRCLALAPLQQLEGLVLGDGEQPPIESVAVGLAAKQLLPCAAARVLCHLGGDLEVPLQRGHEVRVVISEELLGRCR